MGKGLLPHHTLMVIPGEYCGETRGWRAEAGSALAYAGTRPPGRMGDGARRREGRREVAMRGETALGCESQDGVGTGGRAGEIRAGVGEGKRGGEGCRGRPPTWPAAVTVLLLPPGRPAGACPPGPSGPTPPREGSRRSRLRFRSGTGAGRSRRPPSRRRPAGCPGRCSGRPRRRGSSGGGRGQRRAPRPASRGPAHRSAQPRLGLPALTQYASPHPESPRSRPQAGSQPLTFGNPSISPEPVDGQTADHDSDIPAPGQHQSPVPPSPWSTNPFLNLPRGPTSVPGPRPLGVPDGGSGRGSVMALLV